MIKSFISPILLLFLYILIILPLAFFFRINRKDFLDQKINKKTLTYWKKRKKKIGSMNNQY